MSASGHIRALGVSRVFKAPDGSSVAALGDVNLTLPKGSLAVVVGPSGCGKSTLLNVLGLLDRCQGSLLIDGVEASGLSNAGLARLRRAHVGFLFQDGGLIEPMTAGASIELGLIYKRIRADERAAIVKRTMQDVGLEGREHAPVSTLSGGERQRVALARALGPSPSILVCDEPSAALDEANTRMISQLLRTATERGVTVVCASHDPLLIASADIRIEMARGRITAVVH